MTPKELFRVKVGSYTSVFYSDGTWDDLELMPNAADRNARWRWYVQDGIMRIDVGLGMTGRAIPEMQKAHDEWLLARYREVAALVVT